MRIDFHSHILFGMDDGAKTIDESLKMLKILHDDNVDTVLLTPHFYRENENIESFLNRRSKAFSELNAAIENPEDYPKLVLGAECYYYPSFASENVSNLCIGDTNFLLLELPYEKFSEHFIRSLQNSIDKCGCKVIFAHIERYLNHNSLSDLEELIYSSNVLCQMNCDSIINANFLQKKKLIKMLDNNLVQIIGTDAHNLKERAPHFNKAEKIITKHDKTLINRIYENNKMIMQDESISYILSFEQ